MSNGRDHATADQPIVAVCCDDAATLALYDLGSGDSPGAVAVGSHPVHATLVDGRVFVATMGERSVSVVDTDGTVSAVETGVLGPSHFARAAGHLFVPCTAGDVVAVIDPHTLELVTRVPVGAEPHDAVAHEARVYVGSRSEGVVSVIDASSRERRTDIDVGADARVQGVEVHPPTGRGFAVDQRGGRVVSFSLGANPGVLGEATVGANPYDLFVRDDHIYVPGRGAGTVHRLDTALNAGTVHEAFTTPTQVIRHGRREWVVDSGTDSLVSVDGARTTLPEPGFEGLSTDEGILLSHYDEGLVSLVDPGAGVVWSEPAPANPFGLLVL
jgi:outer membrane protein assembly factor BamB